MREAFAAVPDGWRILVLLGVSMAFLLFSVLIDKLLSIVVNSIMKIYDRSFQVKY